MKMSSALFEEYSKNPIGTDEKVRKTLNIPDNRYYSVSMMNSTVGEVYILPGTRVVKTPKVSKSDQK